MTLPPRRAILTVTRRDDGTIDPDLADHLPPGVAIYSIAPLNDEPGVAYLLVDGERLPLVEEGTYPIRLTLEELTALYADPVTRETTAPELLPTSSSDSPGASTAGHVPPLTSSPEEDRDRPHAGWGR